MVNAPANIPQRYILRISASVDCAGHDRSNRRIREEQNAERSGTNPGYGKWIIRDAGAAIKVEHPKLREHLAVILMLMNIRRIGVYSWILLTENFRNGETTSCFLSPTIISRQIRERPPTEAAYFRIGRLHSRTSALYRSIWLATLDQLERRFFRT